MKVRSENSTWHWWHACNTGMAMKIFLAGAASRAINRQTWFPTAEPFVPPASFPILQLIITDDSFRPFSVNGYPRPLSIYYFPLVDAILTPIRLVGGLVERLAHNNGLRGQDMWLSSASHGSAYALPTLETPSRSGLFLQKHLPATKARYLKRASKDFFRLARCTIFYLAPTRS